MLRRSTLSLTLLLVFALAVPASAATWRNLGIAKSLGYRATGEYAFAAVDTTARGVEKIQVGLRQNSGRTRTLNMDIHIVCSREGGAIESKERVTLRTVEHGTWRWYTVWNRPRRFDSCQIYANGYRKRHYAGINLQIRVQ